MASRIHGAPDQGYEPPKSLMRMFGPGGNPQARNLFEVINHLQEREGIRLEVRVVR